MIPYSYNMVDMGGIDLAEANGTVVPGVYEKIAEAMNLCGDLILYNWKFAGINIAPSAYVVIQQTNSILINGLIQVTESDEVTVLGIEPPPPPIVPVSPLEVNENGLYEAEPPASGFNPVRVTVPDRVVVISPLNVDSNGTYEAPIGTDGFNPVVVDVETGAANEEPIETDFVGGYVAGGSWIASPSDQSRSDIYEVTQGHYLISLGSEFDNRYRVLFTTVKPTASASVSGVGVYTLDPPVSYASVTYYAPSAGYITIGKSNRGVEGIETYVFNIENLISSI